MEKKKTKKVTPKKPTTKKVVKKKTKKKGFTLIELLAVIIILGVLMIIAIPSVTSYISSSRKSSYVNTAQNIVSGVRVKVNDGSLGMYDTDTTYYIPYDMIKGENELKSPYGAFTAAYVVVTFNGTSYDYYWTSVDTTNTGMYLTYAELLDNDSVVSDMESIDTTIGVGNRSKIVVYNDAGNPSEPSTNVTEPIAEKGKYSNGEAIEPVSFATDSWTTIAKAVKENNTSVYHVGDTKQVDLGELGIHTVRIANMSKPSSCSTEGYSQTACGFVVEFADIISTQRMNPNVRYPKVNGEGNIGGWEYSEAREYLNSTVYNSLPANLKSVIIDTFVVSGHGGSDATNFLTIDKLYLLSKVEVDGNTTVYSNVYDNTLSRGLDYYSEYRTNNSVAIKNYNGQPGLWCLRTAVNDSSSAFYGLRKNDGWIVVYNACSGMSPAFRIG